jgi:hypothetical protein
MPTSFVAYPSNPPEIGTTIKQALAILGREHASSDFRGWEESDIAGRFITEPIIGEISAADLLSADITRLNFNVTYEIGFAIGKQKRLILIRNGSLKADDDLIREVGIFDTLGYKAYNNARQLVGIVAAVTDLKPTVVPSPTNQKSPVFVILPKLKTDLETQLVSRIKKAFRMPYRAFDPEEHGRLPAPMAITNVADSHAVVVPLLPSSRQDSEVHNLRAAFVAGLAHGMEKELLFLQFGSTPVPLDIRDLVKPVLEESRLDALFADFAPEVFSRYYSDIDLPIPRPDTLLQRLSLGASAAENEMSNLPKYYLETEEYRRVSRGETQIVTGRKGSGKTALFVRLRDATRRLRNNVILDLRPEGFQLLKFKDVVLTPLEQGTKEHVVTAFWEYLLLLEVCHKILEKDRDIHLTNHKLYEPYRKLADQYGTDAYVSEGDFAERLLKLMQRIIASFGERFGDTGTGRTMLTSQEITGILYQHDTRVLRDLVAAYLGEKEALWILFDNVDKGWPASGLGADDILIIRGLVEAISKLERFIRRKGLSCFGVVFLRNDVYELLLEHTSDRGKTSRAILDWTDPELLRELLRLRIVANETDEKIPFGRLWQEIAVSHVGSEESSTYMIDRCLMRPRSLIDFLQYCRSHAINLGHRQIDGADIRQGEQSYSSELVANIGLEIRDVFPTAGDVLYEFVGYPHIITLDDVTKVLQEAGIQSNEQQTMLDLLLWYGFLGVLRDTGEVAYIYNVSYDKRRLQSLMRRDAGRTAFAINPAFWAGLEIQGP